MKLAVPWNEYNQKLAGDSLPFVTIGILFPEI